MNKALSKKLAQDVTTEDLKQMFINAKTNIKNWETYSSVNKLMTKGTSWNILSKCEISDTTHILVKINMIREFGEHLPNYEEIMKDRKREKKPFLYPVHQDPNFNLPF